MSLIKEHKSWKIIDSTKLQKYLECPRSYFYEYILGWRPDQPDINLEFGKAWHLAMEYILVHGYSEDSIIEGWNLLNNHYRQFWGPEYDEGNSPKNPGKALMALMDYVNEYRGEEKKQNVVYTEISGTVPMSHDKVIHFRMDSIIEVDGYYISREHKTGSVLSRVWTDQWAQSVQTGTYNHVLYCLYPYEQVKGVEINGAFFQKTQNKFQRVPCRRSREMMRDWFWTVLNTINLIDWDTERMLSCKESDDVMMAFQKNPTSCTKYFGCRYSDFCLAWPNPLRRAQEVPMGMKVEWWDPSEEESKVQFNF